MCDGGVMNEINNSQNISISNASDVQIGNVSHQVSMDQSIAEGAPDDSTSDTGSGERKRPFDTLLRDRLSQHFDMGELRDLCLELNLDFESIAGANKTEKVTELMLYLERRNQLEVLLAVCGQLRPHVDWKSVF